MMGTTSRSSVLPSAGRGSVGPISLATNGLPIQANGFHANNAALTSNNSSATAWRPSLVGEFVARRMFAAAAASPKASATESGKASEDPRQASEDCRQHADSARETKGSEERKKASGEYDTQASDRRVGNPLSWPNPVSGPSMDDRSSPKWARVYPIGAVLIFLGCLYSRRKNTKKQKEADLLASGNGKSSFGGRGSFTAPPSH